MIVSVSMFNSESLFTVSMILLWGRELPFAIGLYYSLKKSLNRLASTKKSITNSLFNRRGGINDIFEALTNVIKIVGNKIMEYI